MYPLRSLRARFVLMVDNLFGKTAFLQAKTFV
jgi:hypothetical protein